MKKFVYLSIAFLSGCGAIIPKQAAYKISDRDTKKFLVESYKAMQCLYPQKMAEANNDLSKLSDGEELETFVAITTKGLLSGVVGAVNAQKILSDPLSGQYFMTQLNKFKSNFKPMIMSKEDCKVLKNNFNSALKQFRAEMKRRELAQKEEERKRKEWEAYLKTPAGQMELARMQQERQHQEMISVQRQQMAQMERQQFNQQMQQINQQIQQTNMQMMQQMTPQRVIVTPSYQAPCTGRLCWNPVHNNVY